MYNNKTASISFMVGMFFAASAYAGPSASSLAFVSQATGYSSGAMNTADIFKPSMQVLEAARPAVNSSSLVGNLSLVYQSGDFNTASIEQTGTGNVGFIQQQGYMNSATIQQVGVGHQAFISQQGYGNVAIIRQR